MSFMDSWNDKQIREFIDIIDSRVNFIIRNNKNIVSTQVGTITAVNGSNLDVRLQGDTTSITLENKSNTSSPNIGDSVRVLKPTNSLNDAFVFAIF